MSAAIPLAFLAGACGALAAVELVGGAARGLPALAGGGARLVDAVVRLGREGRDPGAAERRRLLLAGAATAFLTGAAVLGLLPAVALAAAGPWAVARVLRARRERYRRAVDGGAAEVAAAIADAIAGGHSLRAALSEASCSVAGPAGHELRKAVAELAAGARTEDALEAMRARVGSEQLDAVLAACLLQRRVGGDLARLLRETARSMEEQARLDGELRAATAQARFTGLLVVVLPLGGALLAELASPGWLAGLWRSFLTAWLVGLAIALQVIAAVLIRRLASPRQ
jgi:tight adherence protein B